MLWEELQSMIDEESDKVKNLESSLEKHTVDSSRINEMEAELKSIKQQAEEMDWEKNDLIEEKKALILNEAEKRNNLES